MRSSENGDERVSLKLKSQSFQTTLFFTCNLPPLPSGGRGLGRGWLYGQLDLDFSSETQSHPHPNLLPPDGGMDKIAVAAGGRLKIKVLDFRQPHHSSSDHAKRRRRHSHKRRGRLKPIFQTTSFLFQKRSALTPSLLLAKSLPVRRCRGRSSVLRWSARPKRRGWNLSG